MALGMLDFYTEDNFHHLVTCTLHHMADVRKTSGDLLMVVFSFNLVVSIGDFFLNFLCFHNLLENSAVFSKALMIVKQKRFNYSLFFSVDQTP